MLDVLEAPARQAAALDEAAHRPWPLPAGPWLLAQTLDDLVLAHWRAEPAALAPLLPRGVELEILDGSAWLTVAAFRAGAVRVRGTLPLPLLSSFAQLNVRTYATAGGRPGVVFLGIETSSRLAAEGSRRLFGLPARHARVRVARAGGGLVVAAAREAGRAFSARVRPKGEPAEARPGTLAHALAERYCLYVEREGTLVRGEVHHRPWRLREARGSVDVDTLTPRGLVLAAEPELVQAAERADLLVWPLATV